MSLDVYLQLSENEDEYSWHHNITSNLGQMAKEADLYVCLWRPDEIGITQADQLPELLEKGLLTLLSNPDRFRKFEPQNGWGDYETLVGFVVHYLIGCRDYPAAKVRVSK